MTKTTKKMMWISLTYHHGHGLRTTDHDLKKAQILVYSHGPWLRVENGNEYLHGGRFMEQLCRTRLQLSHYCEKDQNKQRPSKRKEIII